MAVEISDAKTQEIAGLTTRYLKRGDGAPVLVLHGWGASLEAVHPIVAELSGRCSVYALDLPGFGATSMPPETWGSTEYADFVCRFMDEHGLERAAVVGHSHGGRIAIRLAVAHPERVTKLVLVDSAGIRPRRTFKYRRRVALAKLAKQVARFGGRRGRLLRERLVQRTASADYLSAGPLLRATFVRIVNEDLRDLLGRIAVPTLLIWGALDTDTPLEHGKLMEQSIPDAGLVVFERAGHFSYADEPVAFGRVVRHFLTGSSDK